MASETTRGMMNNQGRQNVHLVRPLTGRTVDIVEQPAMKPGM